jgi:hypothetical protein
VYGTPESGTPGIPAPHDSMWVWGKLERREGLGERYRREVESIRKMRNHYAASGIPPSEIPSGAHVSESVLTQALTN